MFKKIARVILVALGGTLLIAQTGAVRFKTLYNFKAQNGDGQLPYMGGLYMDQNGALYGTTAYGGSSGNGTVFQLSPPVLPGGDWTESVIHNFLGGNDGANPASAITSDQTGVLYGTTDVGGEPNRGTVFQLTPPAMPNGAWTESVLYSFLGGSHSDRPGGAVIIGPGGELYGTTGYGGSAGLGTAFQLTPPAAPGGQWTETILHSFTGGRRDGATPVRALVRDNNGTLYGTTVVGGTSGLGTVFRLIPPALPGGQWTESVLHDFPSGSGDGAYPYALLVAGTGGVLYGTTEEGGASDNGTVYQMTPPVTPGGEWTEAVLYCFQGGADGARPYSGVSLAGDGRIYGTNISGGSAGFGTVFVLKPPVAGGHWTETILHNFTGLDGGGSETRPLLRPGVFYGATVAGGSGGVGTIFELTP